MARLPRTHPPPPPPLEPPFLAEPDPDADPTFDPVEEWLVQLDRALILGDDTAAAAMASEIEIDPKCAALEPSAQNSCDLDSREEVFASVCGEFDQKGTVLEASGGVRGEDFTVLDGSMLESCEFDVKDCLIGGFDRKGGEDFAVLDGPASKSCDFGANERIEMGKDGLDKEFGPKGANLEAPCRVEAEDFGVLDSSALKSFNFAVKQEVEMERDGLVEQSDTKNCVVLDGSVSRSCDFPIKEEFSQLMVGADMKNANLVKEPDGDQVGSNGKVRSKTGGEEGDDESSEESEESKSSDDDEDEDSSSVASSSSEEGEQEDSEDGGHGAGKGDKMKGVEAFLEDGEIGGSDEEEDTVKGPIRSKHEVEVLPPVPKIEVRMEPHHQTLPVGTISAIMGERVIVEGSIRHNPLNEGSILWITESRIPLGLVDELFGPVKNPYYLVRYNSEEEVPAGISVGTAVSYVTEFADHILNMKEIYVKGYDASGENDEELGDEIEFSDDEKEAEYRRTLRQAKRQMNDRQHGPPQKPFIDKRSRPKAAGVRNEMGPAIPNAPAPGHQRRVHCHDREMVLPVTDIAMCSLGAVNLPMSAPAISPPVPMGPAMAPAVQLAAQMGGRFGGPSPQLLPQQPHAVWPDGFPQQQNMGMEGTLAANILQNLLIGVNNYQQQLQNQNNGGFSNGFPSHQQFISGVGIPADPFLAGGQPVNPSLGAPSPVHMGQHNLSEVQRGAFGPSNMQGFGQPPPHRDRGWPPMQFNPGQFNRGNSSFRGRRPHQRGGRHFFGRGGRPQNS